MDGAGKTAGQMNPPAELEQVRTLESKSAEVRSFVRLGTPSELDISDEITTVYW